MRIQTLSLELANQIAAGEVIERPASVVKELLENALDAGAQTIHIMIDGGGVNRIRISDDGQGIYPDDLPLAIAAHATSKIRTLNDLYQIKSMGFRGEALASIASISKLTISSRAVGEDHAAFLQLTPEGPMVSPTARNRGTTVEVQDLFYNAPVRKKFLKTEKTEFQVIETLVRRFAMCRSDIAITLTHNGRPSLAIPAALCEKTKINRIKKLMGKEFVDEAKYIEIKRSGMRLYGWLGGKAYHRSQNDKQWIYVNQRMVKDKLLNHAIKQSYEPFLPPGRFPGCLLYLDIAPEEVDVNVHPTKHEVRFQQPRLVHDLIVSELTEAFGGKKDSTIRNALSHLSTEKRIVREDDYSQRSLINKILEPSSNRVLTVLNSSFIILMHQDDPFLVDVAKLYQLGIKREIKREDAPLKKRPLLVPIRFHALNQADHLIEQYQEDLFNLGIEINRIADHELLIRTIPKLLWQLDIQAFMNALNTQARLSEEKLLNLMVSCCTIKADALSPEECYQLLDFFDAQISEVPNLKPVYLRLDETACRELLNG
ncbi:DNA mismatch repair endonuclease MutL [Legionella impletisoli]|uniref:DNA mismatch repair protein MutL n=1 Tax=Legionella impletisoli TaxID=343510 RepID=A0A917JRQ3_9GAMM|nr:DNA mismatch repair endonuclease MutL [Legionella impletisoli]GGI83103.1 DNA mismatch repair protein MutL [Legionella impletisoli]